MIKGKGGHNEEQNSSDQCMKVLNKNSLKIKKKNNAKSIHLNPEALFNERKSEHPEVKKKKKKKFKSNKPKKSQITTQVQDPAPRSNKLIEMKKSPNNLSSNWKDLLKNLSGDDTSGKDRPAFMRRNKKGQIISNQKINHPKAVFVGDVKAKVKGAIPKNQPVDSEEENVWFDDVDPMLLDTNKDLKSAAGKLVKDNSFQGVTKVLGMDCEMVGVGVDGVDSILARVSIVNHFGNVLYDKFVSPREKVTDYRTAVSGIRPEDLVDAPDFKEVQTEVAELIKDRILVGHALHHDLKVLFLDHPKKFIRDTSKYKPFKTAFGNRTPGLKALAERFLGVVVQTGEHSSVQDSQAAVRLYTMFRQQWEEQRKTKLTKNNNNKKKSASKSKSADQLLEPSRLIKAKEASKSIGSRPVYAPSDSEDE